MTTRPTVVWSEIPVTDLEAARAFYGAVFDWKLSVMKMGEEPVVIFNDATDVVGGNLYVGKPAQDGRGPTLHLAIPASLEAACEACKKAGGTIVSEPIEIPEGRFAYATDPDGNSLSLFEPKAG